MSTPLLYSSTHTVNLVTYITYTHYTHYTCIAAYTRIFYVDAQTHTYTQVTHACAHTHLPLKIIDHLLMIFIMFIRFILSPRTNHGCGVDGCCDWCERCTFWSRRSQPRSTQRRRVQMMCLTICNANAYVLQISCSGTHQNPGFCWASISSNKQLPGNSRFPQWASRCPAFEERQCVWEIF